MAMKTKHAPDRRRRWNDPDLPFHVKGEDFDPEFARRMFEQEVASVFGPPHWSVDPTYDLHAKRRKGSGHG